MSSEVKAVEIRAELRQIKSMADGTYNIILNAPEDALPMVKELMGWVRDEIKAVVVNETQAPSKREENDDRSRSRRKVRQGQ